MKQQEVSQFRQPPVPLQALSSLRRGYLGEHRRYMRLSAPISFLPMQLLLLIVVVVAIFPSSILPEVGAMPLQAKIRHGDRECFLEWLNAGESVTISAIVLQGDQLRAQLQFEGPVLDRVAESGQDNNNAAVVSTGELRDALSKIDQGHTPEDPSTYLHFVETIDFEHLKLAGGQHGDNNADDDDTYDDDYGGGGSKKSDAEREAARNQRRQARERKKALEKKHRQNQRDVNQAHKIRSEGEPFIRTFKTTRMGWYRYCLVATFYPVTVEFDYRKESEMGGLNENGDVMTHEERIMAEEDKMMEKDTASEEGIKDEDFVTTKEKLKTLRRLLAEIQSRQQQERHRLTIHSQTNEHSHSRMVLGSLLETLLFMVVTGIQVATIRRWFKGAPVLGR